jgi:hypothetical protein
MSRDIAGEWRRDKVLRRIRMPLLSRGEVAEGESLEGKCEAAGRERKQGSRGVGEELQTANDAAVVGGVGRGSPGREVERSALAGSGEARAASSAKAAVR